MIPYELPLDKPGFALRKPRAADAPSYYRHIRSDPEVMKYLSIPLISSVEEVEEIMREMVRRNEIPNYRSFAIVNADDELIGVIMLHIMTIFTANVGYCLSKEYWNQGVASACVKSIVDYVRDSTRLYRLEALCDCDNLNSLRVLEKTSFIAEGIMRAQGQMPNLNPAVNRDMMVCSIIFER